ncbi:MAG TPA: TonB-dependent receptor, partial [bacterium]
SGRSYIWDIWTQYDRENPGVLQPIQNHYAVSPRIGLSFPITPESKFYFNYGHFRSNPPYYTMYQVRYRYDKNGLYNMTNPNLAPPRTVQYELGVAYNFYGSWILSVAGYGKDVTGEAGTVNYRDSEGKLNYPNLANNQYEDIQGVEVNLSRSGRGWITGWINLNYMLKKNGLTGRRDIFEDPTLNTDQNGMYSAQETKSLPRPELNANLTFASPDAWGPVVLGGHPLGGWNLTLFGSYSAGNYFTYNPLNKPHVSSNVQWPDYTMVDLKLGRTFKWAGMKATFFMDVSNVFGIQVSALSSGYAFYDSGDRDNYLKSLHLPMYDSPEFDDYRSKYPGLYVGGNDQIGDMRSADKPYINDPNYSFWIYKQPRDIWFGLRFDF